MQKGNVHAMSEDLDLENINKTGCRWNCYRLRLRNAVQRRNMHTCNTDTVVIKI